MSVCVSVIDPTELVEGSLSRDYCFGTDQSELALIPLAVELWYPRPRLLNGNIPLFG
ncbi:hypothetical protein KDW_60490 [Dictyobacter vulcani]|uniref:Uncharacterized protein n=1 Tax=Dictyobacter vulcani TaxID=2607529 RepID=A0A5J4KZC3_9CHLR|nr:hypothetical protein [Dictyobacter vulcani]GER91887.1 hypothetical protein KDW_60490 [Dictyobacter vulcani]